MTPDRKREIVTIAYPGNKWKNRVKAMPDSQVHLVFMRLLNQGKLKNLV